MRHLLPVVTLLCSAFALGAQPNDTKTAIHRLVRLAAENSVDASHLEAAAGKSIEVSNWISDNRESIEATLGGPFAATDRYVTTHKDNRIYVHILDWAASNNVSLPPVIDRVVQKGWLLSTGKPVRVDQAPWGLLLVVPEEQRPDSFDTVVVLEMPGNPSELVAPRMIDAVSAQEILLQGDTAKLEGGLQHNQSPDWIEGWYDLSASIAWKVRVPEAADYDVAIVYACGTGCGGILEIASGDSRLTEALRPTKGMWSDWQNFEKRKVPGKLRLDKGVNLVSVRGREKGTAAELVRIYGVYLLPAAGKRAMVAAYDRAMKLRADAGWLRQAKYGLMVHWMPATTPRHGAPKPFCDAVRDFDVKRFAETADTAGAAYVVFTLAHGIQHFPSPLKSVDPVLSGRTCARDLPKDLAEALASRGIKLILYYHHGVGDTEWSRASGFLSKDKSAFFAHEAAILTEAGLRYGHQLAGWWFDDRYPLQPFERLANAAKEGNRDRIVAFNSWILPKSTDFQDYWAGEVGGELRRLPERGYFGPGGTHTGLQPHLMVFLDDAWVHGALDTPIAAPIFNTQQLIEYIRDSNKKGAAVTLNIGVYQDGSPSPATIEQLQAVRKAIRGR